MQFTELVSVVTKMTTTGSYDSLNQYTQRTVPGYVWEVGNAASNATVTVNLQATTRKGQYFSEELSVNNSSSAVYTQLVTVGVLKNAGSNQQDIVTSSTGKVFVAQSPEIFGYDLDGDLTNDGRWAYSWDGENRLVQMQTLTNLPATVPQEKLLFGYDYLGRRVSKVVSNFNGSAWSATINLKSVWDGWNLLAELDSTNGLVRSYVWGSDLSGTPQGAGGVGGLLWLTQNAAQPTNDSVAFDGNANVMALVDANTGSNTAQYAYGPFGEIVRADGTAAKANPFRFSTKYMDAETTLPYYDYRYYNPGTGRWLSRDREEGNGGLNPYALVDNEPISFTDPLGLWKWKGGKRDGNDRATVVAEKCGDPYKTLALLVNLDPSEVQKWLTTWKANDEVKKDDEFTVPNVVYLNKVGIPAFKYFLWVVWADTETSTLKGEGYKVQVSVDPSVVQVKGQFNSGDVFGIVNVGHGDFSLGGDLEAADYSISPGEPSHQHRLGAIKLVQCYGDIEAAEWRARQLAGC